MELWKIGARLRYLHGRTPSCQPGDIETLIKELDPIGGYSTSYPFLALARHIGARYGDVLHFVEYLTVENPLKSLVHHSRHYVDGIARLTHEQRELVMRRVHRMRQDEENQK